MVTIHFERFPPGTVRKLPTRRTGSYRVLRGLFPLPMSWISHEILGSVQFSMGRIWSFWCICFSRSIIDCSWSVTEASSTSITLVQTWYTNVGSTITTMTRLRRFVRDCSIQPRRAWHLLSLHSPEMKAFKPGRMIGTSLQELVIFNYFSFS